MGSPTYFADITSEMKALIERAGFTSMANGLMFKRKVGADVIAVRRGGAIHAFDYINEMIVPGSSYWNIGMGRETGDVDKDEEGIRNMKNLGENMAWLFKKIRSE
jgi:multimeric flavodoxin WrbA